MEIRWLEDFCALARTRHFSRAADEQNITQPTFSRRIKLLEEEMGMLLIDRETLPLSLTPAGKLFLETSEKITSLLKETKEACLELERVEAQKLRFATNQSLYLSFFRHWLEGLNTQVDIGVNLKAAAWDGRQLVQALEQGQCDLIVSYWSRENDLFDTLDGPGYEHLSVAEETLLPVTALNAQGEPKYQLPGQEKSPLPYISYNDQTMLNRVISSHLLRVVQTPHLLVVNENANATSVKAMVAEGYGVGWLPARLLDASLDARLVPAGDAAWHIPLEIRVYRACSNHHKQLEKLWVEIEKSLQC
jgi:DNA-binding transcriptional LysR family regulator